MLSLIYSIFQELNQRAQGEVTIREAIRELDLWGAAAVFTLTEYEDSNKNTIHLIKDWKDLVNQVRSLFSFLAHLSRRLRGELLVYQWLLRPSSVGRPSTFSNIFSSETAGPIELKFHMETP